MSLAKVPYYGFVGWVGLVAIVTLLVQPRFDLAPAFGWGVVATTILLFYLTTIESEDVAAPNAGWILSVGSIVVVFSAVPEIQTFVWVLAVGALVFAVAFPILEKTGRLDRLKPRPRAPKPPKPPAEEQYAGYIRKKKDE